MNDNVIRGDSSPIQFKDRGIVGFADIPLASFHDVIEKSKGVTMVEFWRPQCGCCDMIKPILADMAEDYKHAIRFYRVEGSEELSFKDRHRVQGFPLMCFYYDGVEMGRIEGSMFEQFFWPAVSDILEKISTATGQPRIFRRATEGLAGNARP